MLFKVLRVQHEDIFQKQLAEVRKLKSKPRLEGKLFGSVTTQDIAKAVTLYGVPVEKEAIKLSNGPFKMLGEYTVKVILHHDAVAEITINIIAE